MTGEECMLQEYQTVQLITQQQQNSITRKVSMLSEEHWILIWNVPVYLETVAASLLGHTEKVNEENYTYDVSSMEEKSKFMECAGRV